MRGLQRMVVLGVVASMFVVSGSAGALAAPAGPASGGTPTTGSATDDAPATTASATDAAPTTIDSCTRIAEPGVYVLGEDVLNASATQDTGISTGNDTARACILIASSDVELHGGGHVLEGEGYANETGSATTTTANETGNAIPSESENATVASSFDESERSQFPVGVAVRGANGSALSNVTVSNLSLSNWAVGALAANASSTSMVDVNASANANVGIEYLDGADGLVANSTADDNGFAGLYASETRNLTVLGGSFDGNGFLGVNFFGGNEAPVVANATVSGSGIAGIAAVQSSDVVVADSTVESSGGDDRLFGFSASYLFVGVSNATVLDSATRDDDSWAVYATDCANGNGTCPNETESESESGPEASGVGAVTVSEIDVDGSSGPVSFGGADVAVGSVDALDDASPADGAFGLGQGVVATNTTRDAFVDLSTSWGSGRPVGVTNTSFSAENGTPGTEFEDASIAVDGDRVAVSGTIWAPNACYTAALSAVEYDSAGDVLTVAVEATQANASTDTACAQVITEVPYRAVVSLSGPPGAVEVVHVHDGERTVVATTAGNETATEPVIASAAAGDRSA
ncbi:right-handed parallel beta-helix repeat-containing protein [Halorubellus sp. JP-L1]|uniref:right-handed parallel beta-helix repeat-containing protein n=1 Tax=Halorubellus sp. JP-L1 TaxID=2715753 RepID=UPI00140E893C|nr:right-handed parallel beta-helix repeat-containing protein [Halorubellus sp. JP-L1]NHN41275.1 right-handed parallel beta-helix repeat-containing protein [Halorubellus sp. JP-L1]